MVNGVPNGCIACMLLSALCTADPILPSCTAMTSDFCAQLPAGAAASDIRKRYKEMAVALHPDKCCVDGAVDAFRRIVQAQQNLLKYAA